MENIIDKIDRYLDGKMSGDEKTSFENEMKTNPDLAAQVKVQQELRAGIERAGMKTQMAKTFKAKSLKSKIYKWGIATITVATIGSALYYGMNNSRFSSADNNITYDLPATNENGTTLWADADKNLPTQLFTIYPSKDTVIETQSGIVFAIPAGAFVGSSGPITLNVREAVSPLDIIKGGLSTTSNGELLQTAGMFCLDARDGDKPLAIDPKKPILANVPTNEIKPGMMLFDGERKPDGSINWVNPKKPEKPLIPVDITTLDFYPKGFLAKVAELGLDANDKRVTDSIYNSYAGRKSGSYMIDLDPADYDSIKLFYINDARKHGAKGTNAEVELTLPYLFSGDTMHVIMEIDPARIATIWDPKFNNTILATNEFEERLQVIFKYGLSQLLECYVNNLDKPMWVCDSLAMSGGMGVLDALMPEFRDFYNRHDGGVAIDQPHLNELKNYFDRKKKAMDEAAQQVYNAHKAEFESAANSQTQSQNYVANTDAARNLQNFKDEFEVNITSAYKQLDLPRPKIIWTSGLYYGFPVTSTGWHNVDMYVMQSTIARTTLDYTDTTTGKKAVIKYEEVKVNVTEENKYEQIQVYLMPDSLSSFMKVYKTNNMYSEKLNELMHYSLIVVGQKDGKWFYSRRDNVKPGIVDMHMDEIEESQLRTNLETSFTTTAAKDFRTEINAMIMTHEYNIALKKIQKQEEIDNAIMPVIFPYFTAASSAAPVLPPQHMNQ